MRADRLAWPRRNAARRYLEVSLTGWAYFVTTGRSGSSLHKHGVQFRTPTPSTTAHHPGGSSTSWRALPNGARADRRGTRAGLKSPSSLAARQAAAEVMITRSSRQEAWPAGAAQGRGQEPRRVHSDAVPLGASLHARLACFIFRFLRRPQKHTRPIEYKCLLNRTDNFRCVIYR
jgi:hypothetical protein